jgi:hypothetical protein
LRKTRGARRCCWTICFDAVPDHRQFWRLFSDLPVDAQRDAKRAFRLFASNPAHPGLQFKKLEGEDDIYSARIGLDYRALAVMKKDGIIWYWIGRHSEYDRLV